MCCPLQEVDTVTADCLALREQVAIYEEQLAAMKQQHELVRKHWTQPYPENSHAVVLYTQFSIGIFSAVVLLLLVLLFRYVAIKGHITLGQLSSGPDQENHFNRPIRPQEFLDVFLYQHVSQRCILNMHRWIAHTSPIEQAANCYRESTFFRLSFYHRVMHKYSRPFTFPHFQSVTTWESNGINWDYVSYFKLAKESLYIVSMFWQ